MGIDPASKQPVAVFDSRYLFTQFRSVKAMAASMRLLTQALRTLELRLYLPPGAPRPPGLADTAARRLYTAQRHVYRRALRRHRRAIPSPSLEAQLRAGRITD